MALYSELGKSDTKLEATLDDTKEANLYLMALSEVTFDSEDKMPESFHKQIKKLLKAFKS